MAETIIEKDFYDDLPSMVCEILDKKIIPLYSKEPWFEKAWSEYRSHILESNVDTMKMPGIVFKKYVSPQK